MILYYVKSDFMIQEKKFKSAIFKRNPSSPSAPLSLLSLFSFLYLSIFVFCFLLPRIPLYFYFISSIYCVFLSLLKHDICVCVSVYTYQKSKTELRDWNLKILKKIGMW